MWGGSVRKRPFQIGNIKENLFIFSYVPQHATLFSIRPLSLFHEMFGPHAAISRCSSLDRTCCTAMPFLHSILVLEARGSASYVLVPSVVMCFFMCPVPVLSYGSLGCVGLNISFSKHNRILKLSEIGPISRVSLRYRRHWFLQNLYRLEYQGCGVWFHHSTYLPLTWASLVQSARSLRNCYFRCTLTAPQ
jgi:hypothetical protein